MLKEALEKLQVEITAHPKNKYAAVVGGFMMDRIRDHPEDAEKVMVEGKTIAGSLDAMKAEAKKNQANGVGVLTDEEGFAIVLGYYGIIRPQPEAIPAPRSFDVTLDDLL